MQPGYPAEHIGCQGNPAAVDNFPESGEKKADNLRFESEFCTDLFRHFDIESLVDGS